MLNHKGLAKDHLG